MASIVELSTDPSMLKKIIALVIGLTATTSFADTQKIPLLEKSSFLRFSFDNVKMPSGMSRMGLAGLNYYVDITPHFYAGGGTYGAITGTQGGLFTLGVGGGVHHEIFKAIWGDAGIDVGGGGGKSALVGGGLFYRPHIGIAYAWPCARLGLHYSYYHFVDGKIRSSQIGLNLEIPYDFYYVPYQNGEVSTLSFSNIELPLGRYLAFQKNEIAILLQGYKQTAGTKNLSGEAENNLIGVIGAELDHYLTEQLFWYIKAGGAFRGIHNGYMDILGGAGYRYPLGNYLAIIPQLGLGAGGGGNTDTAGGFLIHPQLGLQWPFFSALSGRLSGGYLWAPRGNFKNWTVTAALLYRLDNATTESHPVSIPSLIKTQDWRLIIFNQTYFRPVRYDHSIDSSIQLVGVEANQILSQHVFLAYQATSAYHGDHVGGLATGMLGGGVQSNPIFNQKAQAFAEVLVGAGGGGAVAWGGGSIAEVAGGLHVALTPTLGVQASIGRLKAIRSDLNTTLFNLGLTVRFGTLMT